MTVNEKDKKTKAKNPRIDAVASGVIHTTGQKQNKGETERTILLEGIAPRCNTSKCHKAKKQKNKKEPKKKITKNKIK